MEKKKRDWDIGGERRRGEAERGEMEGAYI
jgi:hypothetical protein